MAIKKKKKKQHRKSPHTDKAEAVKQGEKHLHQKITMDPKFLTSLTWFFFFFALKKITNSFITYSLPPYSTVYSGLSLILYGPQRNHSCSNNICTWEKRCKMGSRSHSNLFDKKGWGWGTGAGCVQKHQHRGESIFFIILDNAQRIALVFVHTVCHRDWMHRRILILPTRKNIRWNYELIQRQQRISDRLIVTHTCILCVSVCVILV